MTGLATFLWIYIAISALHVAATYLVCIYRKEKVRGLCLAFLGWPILWAILGLMVYDSEFRAQCKEITEDEDWRED